MKTYVKPHAGIADCAKKLAQSFMKHWWRHATKKDLTQIQIAKSVQLQTARVWRESFLMVLAGE